MIASDKRLREPIEKRAEYYFYQFLDFNSLLKKYRDINAIQMLKKQYTNIYKKAIEEIIDLLTKKGVDASPLKVLTEEKSLLDVRKS